MKKNILDSSNYINNLPFEHFETYSFQRGEIHKDFQETVNAEIDRLKNHLQTQTEDLKSNEALVYWEKYNAIGQYLFNKQGDIHPTAIKTATFQRQDDTSVELIKILNTKIRERFLTMCVPTFRDAIVFYDDKKTIISVLNICLSCVTLQINNGEYLYADLETFNKLGHFFLSLKHEIEAGSLNQQINFKSR
jgi:hypothetical protein